MKLSGSNYGMPSLPFEAALAFHARLGLRAIEITVLESYRTALSALDRSGRRAMRDALGRAGMICSAIADFQSLVEDPGEQSDAILRHQTGAIDLAADLAGPGGTPILAFYSGGTTSDWPRARARLIDRIGELADHARRRGVTLAMKAHAHGCVARPHQLIDLHEQVNSPVFRFCFDMSHFEVQGLSIEAAMLPLLPLSVHVEVKASFGRAPDQEYLVPGDPRAQSDFTGQLRAMRRLGYAGFVAPEMSVHVQRHAGYDQYSTLAQACQFLTAALSSSGAERSDWA